jgi:hypothetical protein
MYTTLADVKIFLGITDNNSDTKIDMYLAQTKAILDTYLWDLTQGARVFYISFCDFYDGYFIRILARNITAITKINNIAYTGVLDTDYQILPPYNSVLYIKDFWDYNTNPNSFPKFPIEVICGYVSWSSEYEFLWFLQTLMVEWLYAKENGFDVKSYKLWDRSFTFADRDWMANDITSLQWLMETTWLFNVLSILPPV